MKNTFFRIVAVALSLMSMGVSAKSELQQYVEQCEKELGFSASDVDAVDCNDGLRFAKGEPGIGLLINDFVLHKAVNNSVDYVVACRWLMNPDGRSNGATSVEAIIHNRSNAETCFFSAVEGTNDKDDTLHNVSVKVVSPTNFKSTGQNADSYWQQPSDLDSKQLFDTNSKFEPARCVGCHVAGPYIASRNIVPYLAQFGLINDRHDTYADASNSTKHYHAVGSSGTPPYDKFPTMKAFEKWDSYIKENNVIYSSGECNGCHSIADKSTVDDLARYNEPVTMLPSIKGEIDMIRNADPPVMPPYLDPYSDYRWINRDNPGGSGEWETMGDLRKEYPKLYCDAPTSVQAHAVDSDSIFSTDNLALLPDNLNFFNLREGLVCRNSQQADGHQCHDYSTRYECNGKWTDWNSVDTPSRNGDYEERSKQSLPCSAPTGIQARTTITVQIPNPLGGYFSISYPLTFTGPNDRLRYFDTTNGLACVSDEQVNGESCSNYVVRFICPN